MINVIVVTQSDIAQRGIETIVSRVPDISIIGTVRDMKGGDPLSFKRTPHLAILHFDCSCQAKPDLVRQFIGSLKKAYINVNVLTLSDRSNKSLFAFMSQLGVRGHCLQTIEEDDLIAAIRTTATGQEYIQSAYAHHINESSLSGTLTGSFSKRHLEILNLMLLGLSNEEISEVLYISVPTVKAHVKSILRQLEVRDRAQAISKVYRDVIDNTGLDYPSYV